MSATKLTETQQIVLSAAARRGDRCVMLPPRLKGAAAQRVVKKLVDLGLIEEVRARGDLPVWRRDHDGGPMALRITRDGSERIRTGPRGSEKDSVLESESGEQEKGLIFDSGRARGNSRAARPPHFACLRWLQAGAGHRPASAPRGRDHPGHHDGDGLAAALGPWVFLGSGAQEARIGTRFRQDRRQAPLPDRDGRWAEGGPVGPPFVIRWSTANLRSRSRACAMSTF